MHRACALQEDQGHRGGHEQDEKDHQKRLDLPPADLSLWLALHFSTLDVLTPGHDPCDRGRSRQPLMLDGQRVDGA